MLKFLLKKAGTLALVFLLCLCASLLLSGRFTRSVLAPLERIDMEHPETTVCFDELQPFVRRIARQQELLSAAAQLGVSGASDPFITLSFLALPVIPDVRLTDLGVFDVNRMQFIHRPA